MGEERGNRITDYVHTVHNVQLGKEGKDKGEFGTSKKRLINGKSDNLNSHPDNILLSGHWRKKDADSFVYFLKVGFDDAELEAEKSEDRKTVKLRLKEHRG